MKLLRVFIVGVALLGAVLDSSAQYQQSASYNNKNTALPPNYKRYSFLTADQGTGEGTGGALSLPVPLHSTADGYTNQWGDSGLTNFVCVPPTYPFVGVGPSDVLYTGPHTANISPYLWWKWGTNIAYPQVIAANVTNAAGGSTLLFKQFVSSGFTNQFAGGQTNSSGLITNGFYNSFVDIPGFADMNGAYNQNVTLTVSVSGTAATTTNGIGLILSRTVDGRYFSTNAGETFTLGTLGVGSSSIKMLGTNQLVINTNLPTWFTTGARGYRLQTLIVGTNNAASTNLFDEIALGGFSNY